MRCPNCETENRDEAKFCDECGFPLSGSIARVAGAASPKAATSQEVFRNQATEWLPLDEDPVAAETPEPVLYDDGFDLEPDDGNDWLDERGAPEEDAEADGRDGADEADDEDAAWSGLSAFDAPLVREHRDDFDQQNELDASTGSTVPEARRQAVSDTAFIDELPMSDNDYQASAWRYEGENYERQAYARTAPDDAAPTTSMPRTRAEAPRWESYEQGSQGWTGEYTMEMPRLNQDEPVRGRDFRVADGSAGRSRKRLALFIVAGIAVGAIIAALVTYALGFWGGNAVPDVTGMTEADARSVLTDEGFEVRTTQVKSDDTEGLVIIMDPGAGSRAPEGSEVVIHIATARIVPEIVGKNADEAKALLAEAGYDNVRYETQKSDEEENVVVEVSPSEGTRAKSNTEIIVKVTEAYRVPDVSGMDPYSASEAIAEAGLTPEIVYIDTDQYMDGTLIGTNPEAGEKVSEGAYVSISVARARGVELSNLTEQMFSPGNTVTIGGVDYEINSLISVSYQGDDTVAFTATGTPKITFFGETLYASSEQTVSGVVAWSESNEVIGIS